MKAKKMNKLLLVIGLGVGLSGTISGVANAAPGPEDCEEMRWKCDQGNQNACDTLARLARYCYGY